MKESKIIAIYQIKNLVNNKVYIGSTINYTSRKRTHITLLRKGTHSNFHLQGAFSKYGEDSFEFSILEVLPKNSNILECEEKWMITLNSLDREKGYNEDLPTKKEACPSVKSAGIKDFFTKNAPKTLKVMTEEEWLLKRKDNPEFKSWMNYKNYGIGGGVVNRKVVLAISDTGDIVNTFESLVAAANSVNKNVETIRISISKNKDYPKRFSKRAGYYWFEESTFDKEKFLRKVPKEKYVRNRKSITLYNTTEEKTFKSLTDAAVFLGVQYTKIAHLRKGFMNKGNGRISKITHIKGWKIK